MNQLLIAGAETGAITMSSREIAELVESRHDNVKRTIETLFAKGVIPCPQTEEKPTAGRPAIEYLLDKRSSMIVVAQLCPEFTARIVDRWQELEAQVAKPAFQIPTTLAGALRLAAEQAEQIEQQQAQLAIAAPKVEALDRISKADGELCISDAAKAMQIQPRKLFAWMEQHQWIFRRGNKWVAYQDRIQSGYLTHRVTLVERKDGTDKEVAQVLVTAKGQAKLAEVAA